MKNYQVIAALVLAIINRAWTQENQIKAAWCRCIEQQLNQTTHKANKICFKNMKVTAANVSQEIGNGSQTLDVENWLQKNHENTILCDAQGETGENTKNKEEVKDEVKDEVKEGLSTFQIASATVGGILLMMLIIVAISFNVTRSQKFKPNAVPKKSENPEAIEMTSFVETRTVPVAAETRVIVETLI